MHFRSVEESVPQSPFFARFLVKNEDILARKAHFFALPESLQVPQLSIEKS
jgi:hypothetical protein